jgi:hypothetical protein
MIYPLEVYDTADNSPQALASYKSTNPHLREISILFTNAIMEIFDDLRKSIATISKALYYDKEAAKTLLPADRFSLRFSPERIHDVSQRALYVKVPKKDPKAPDELFVCSSKDKMQAIAKKLMEPTSWPKSSRPGILLGFELLSRVRVLFEKYYWPEKIALAWFESLPNQQMQIFRLQPNPIGSVNCAIANEALRRVVAKGFDVARTIHLLPAAEAKVAGGDQFYAGGAKISHELLDEVALADKKPTGLSVHCHPDNFGCTW